jgi:2-succinyl-6-hydroxy-2,4-cyclohexadiene-1-carboxylate synthase
MFIHIHGVNYYVEMRGTGKPLVLLHGFTGSSQIWQDCLHALSDTYQLIAIDLLGHGQTQCPPEAERYQMQHQVNDLHQLTHELGLDKFVLLGYSMGGRIALSYAMHHPETVKALILESSSPGIAEISQREERYRQDTELAERILEHGVERFVNEWEKLPLFQTQYGLPSDVVHKQREIRLHHTKQGLAHALKGASVGRQPSWWEHLTKFHMPTLLIFGELDAKFMQINTLMAQQLPLCEYRQITRSGHTPHLENPTEFQSCVRTFLETLN